VQFPVKNGASYSGWRTDRWLHGYPVGKCAESLRMALTQVPAQRILAKISL